MDLPKHRFPAADRGAILRFWLVYWCWFLLFLPWMLLRQLGITARDLWWAWRTCGRTYRVLDGRLTIGFVGSAELLVTAGMFGERFTWVRWGDLVIDPGPARSRAAVQQGIAAGGAPAVVVCTHFHEEHIGNAVHLGVAYGIAVLGSEATCAALRQPPRLPAGRQLLMGQADADDRCRIERLDAEVRTPGAAVEVIAAEGHCRGHVVLFAREAGVLFAGDAFLHELFTSPNSDADHRAWIDTLERLSVLPIRTLVSAHGVIISSDPAVPVLAGVVRREDPMRLIAAKLAFLRWARTAVDEGETLGLPYPIIEATIFPWQHTWSWRTWFHDEGFRLLTCGEFSRTHLVRSLSTAPTRVPARFPAFVRVGRRLAELGPELLRIHVLAARPEAVLVIAGSILGSAAVLLVAAPAGPLPQALASAAPTLIRAGGWGALLLVLAVWVGWWAVAGGAITRRMALAIAGHPAEPWRASLRWCLRPALLLPSALASLCLLAIAVAGAWPWALVAVPVVWLVAGVIYAHLCVAPGTWAAAWSGLGRIRRRPWAFVANQALFLVGFVASTGLVHALAWAWLGLARAVVGDWSWATWALAAPALIYALGYTTANLKSLQIWLALRPDDA